MRLAPLFALIAAPVWADTCPPGQDYSAELSALADQANAAPDERSGRAVSGKMWQLWLRAPDAASQAVLDRGMRQRESHDFSGAYASFARLADYCPNYAEGYNQRAYINFLRGHFAAALVDLDTALALSPNHVGAQSGRALTLLQLGRVDTARMQLKAALENNPWLSERALMERGGPLVPPGEDI
jgi:Flp pilus assembly protein TadD